MGGEGEREEADPFLFSSRSFFFSPSLSSLSFPRSLSRDLSLLLSLPRERERERWRLRERDFRPLLRERERREEYALGGVRDRRLGERDRDRRLGERDLDLRDLDGRSLAGMTTMPDLERDRRRRGERERDLRGLRGDLDLLPLERDLRRRPLDRDLDLLLDLDLERL